MSVGWLKVAGVELVRTVYAAVELRARSIAEAAGGAVVDDSKRLAALVHADSIDLPFGKRHLSNTAVLLPKGKIGS